MCSFSSMFFSSSASNFITSFRVLSGSGKIFLAILRVSPLEFEFPFCAVNTVQFQNSFVHLHRLRPVHYGPRLHWHHFPCHHLNFAHHQVAQFLLRLRCGLHLGLHLSLLLTHHFGLLLILRVAALGVLAEVWLFFLRLYFSFSCLFPCTSFWFFSPIWAAGWY